jgi:hypothetical protein
MAHPKIKLNSPQRKHLADLLKDSANVVLASLVIGQFVERTVNVAFIILAGVTYLALVVYTTRLQGGEQND